MNNLTLDNRSIGQFDIWIAFLCRHIHKWQTCKNGPLSARDDDCATASQWQWRRWVADVVSWGQTLSVARCQFPRRPCWWNWRPAHAIHR